MCDITPEDSKAQTLKNITQSHKLEPQESNLEYTKGTAQIMWCFIFLGGKSGLCSMQFRHLQGMQGTISSNKFA